MDGFLLKTGKTRLLAHREMFDGMLQAVLTNENLDELIKSEDDLRAVWPFDL